MMLVCQVSLKESSCVARSFQQPPHSRRLSDVHCFTVSTVFSQRENSANDSGRSTEPVRAVDISLLSELSTESEDDENTAFAREIVGRVLDSESPTGNSPATQVEV